MNRTSAGYPLPLGEGQGEGGDSRSPGTASSVLPVDLAPRLSPVPEGKQSATRHSPHILVMNAGSSSLKIGLFDWPAQEKLAEEGVDWSDSNRSTVRSHGEAAQHLLSRIDVKKVGAVGHRVVHGGDFNAPVRIDHRVKTEIGRLAELAPLHNRAALDVIEATEQAVPDVPQVATFDTAFHRTMLPEAHLYPVPYEWRERWGIRRFGFHGLSHAYCAGRAAELLASPPNAPKLVSCHLGNGCSLAAIADGHSVDTTMGFTPLEGLMMGTRSGTIDPGILIYLLNHHKLGLSELDRALNHESGLKGVSGISSDMREVLAAAANGNQRARVAFDLFVYRLTQGIASMAAALGGVDAIVFTAGIGENSAVTRQAVCAKLGWLGARLDEPANAAAEPDCDVATPDARVRILVIHTREDLMIARETRSLLAE